jgi:hypothetical protein
MSDPRGNFAYTLHDNGYRLPIPIAGGRWLAVQQQLYTVGLFVIDDGDLFGYRCRFCYRTTEQALAALFTWDGQGDDPPGPWVKQKGCNSQGQPVDRLNPRLADPEAKF